MDINRVKKYILLLPLIFLTGCPYGYKYNQGLLPTLPVNIEDFNTEYDDYNMDVPVFGTMMPVLFSSNRNSAGGNYDIVYEIFEIWFNRDDGSLTAGRSDNRQYDMAREFLILEMVPPTINTKYNELGPYLIDFYSLYSSYETAYRQKYFIMYANDQSGNLDIMYTLNHHPGNDSILTFIDPKTVTFLNSDYNEAYPCVDLEFNRVYFCSDQNGDYDIFLCELPSETGISDVIQDTLINPPLFRSDILSSEEDDKCPYVAGNIIVFTSNRNGGFGGFDLWYAQKESTGWSVPVNFGEKINTGNNEYRPVIVSMPEFRHDLLMFSSDRPMGKGGFDLYYVGVDKLIETEF